MAAFSISTRTIALAVFFAIPVVASAGILSFISNLLTSAPSPDNASAPTSQTMALLTAAPALDPQAARGGGDITVVADSALLSDVGPLGSLADVSTNNKHGYISVYVVRPGDTISQIAKMFDVTSNTIIWQNNIRGGLIREGQTLVILPISGVQHQVKKGDTIASIAKFYRADADEIRAYNDISADTDLSVGSVIIVPDGEVALAAANAPSAPTARLRGAGGPEYAGYYLRPIIGGRKTQGLHGYNGVDLASYYGAAVMAAASGQVIIARMGGWNGGYGNYVVIAHQNGTQTLYAHLSSMNVYAGQSVTQGQVIGAIGSTGKSTGPHLHFEIRGAKNPF